MHAEYSHRANFQKKMRQHVRVRRADFFVRLYPTNKLPNLASNLSHVRGSSHNNLNAEQTQEQSRLLIQKQYRAGLGQQRDTSAYPGSQRGGLGRMLVALKILDCHGMRDESKSSKSSRAESPSK